MSARGTGKMMKPIPAMALAMCCAKRWRGDVQESVGGKNVEWMEMVSDAQYGK